MGKDMGIVEEKLGGRYVFPRVTYRSRIGKVSAILRLSYVYVLVMFWLSSVEDPRKKAPQSPKGERMMRMMK